MDSFRSSDHSDNAMGSQLLHDAGPEIRAGGQGSGLADIFHLASQVFQLMQNQAVQRQQWPASFQATALAIRAIKTLHQIPAAPGNPLQLSGN